MNADTAATRAIRTAGVAHEVVRFPRPRSVEESAASQGIDPGNLFRTIVIRRGADDYLFVLVPGGRAMDWAKVRRVLGVRRVSLPDADEAKAATGYERGTITPLGSTHRWPVYADATIADAETVSIGGGAHGVAIHLGSRDLIEVLDAAVADLTKPADAD